MTASIPDLLRLARRAEDTLSRTLTTLARDLERIEDEAFSTLRAQSFEPAEATVSLWCQSHDQALLRCENQDRDGCIVGTHLDEGPDRSDPTGEAAGRANPAKGLLKQVRRDLEALERLTGHLAALVRPVELVDGSVLATAARKAQSENAKAGPCCEVCANSGRTVAPHSPGAGRTMGATNVGGRLPDDLLLCSWHYQFVERNDRLPDDREEAQHQAGKRVTVRVDPAPARPKGIGEQFRRLNEGIRTGSLGDK